MAPPSNGPPRWLERLVALLAPDTPAGRASLGDLHERWGRTRRNRGAVGAALWYLGEGLALGRYRGRSRIRVVRTTAGDVALSMRSLLRQPVLVAATLITLVPALAAAGVGLAVSWTALLRPLPHPEPDRLVVLQHTWEPFGSTGISTALYDVYRTRSRSLARVGVLSRSDVNAVLPGGATRRMPAVYATASALELLGALPAAGRLLTGEEDRAGGPRTALLTHQLWTDAFDGDPSVVGRSLVVEGVDHTVVGVLEEGLEFLEGRPLLVLPVAMDDESLGLLDMEWWYGIGRLAPGTAADAAERELGDLLRQAVVEAPDGRTTTAALEANGIAPAVTPLLEWQTGQARDFVLALAGAVALLLGLAAAATGTLLLGRAESRTPEIRIRRALGAGGGRLLLHLLADAVVLCLTAGALAAPVAWLATRALNAASGLHLPRTEVSWLPLAAAAGAAALSVALVPVFGIVPLGQARASRGAPTSSRVSAWTGLRRLLLGFQVAVSTVLLTATLGLGGSVRALADAPLGFRPEGVLTFALSLPEADYPEPERARAFHRSVVEGVRRLPGVISAGFGGGLPVPEAAWGGAVIQVDGHGSSDDANPTHRWSHVSEGFLEALGVPLLAGRGFEDRDRQVGPGVVLVNEAFARLYWGGTREAVGRRLRPARAPEWSEVVGVVGSTADRGPGAEPDPVVFAPERSTPPWDARWNLYAIRTSTPPEALVPAVREVVRAADAAVPLFDVATLTERVRAASARERLALRGVLFSGLASILVVAASLAGLVLLSLLRRRREIGVRKAVGATDRRMRWLLLSGALLPAAAGLAAGAAAVAAGLRVPASLLHGDVDVPAVLAGASGLILGLVLGTGLLASLRVARIEPSEALRAD